MRENQYAQVAKITSISRSDCFFFAKPTKKRTIKVLVMKNYVQYKYELEIITYHDISILCKNRGSKSKVVVKLRFLYHCIAEVANSTLNFIATILLIPRYIHDMLNFKLILTYFFLHTTAKSTYFPPSLEKKYVLSAKFMKKNTLLT